jgi:hypothetical protein
MKLVTSNEPEAVKSTIDAALAAYQDKPDVQQTVNILTRLKGIGPATASLLLSVHDPEKVIFFSDEAFYWLCCGGRAGPIKYDKKEYAELHLKAGKVVQRLGVSPIDVEKVAYVLFKHGDLPLLSASKVAGAASDKTLTKTPAVKSVKRKTAADGDDNGGKRDDAPPLRRSKRKAPKTSDE